MSKKLSDTIFQNDYVIDNVKFLHNDNLIIIS